MKRICVFAGSNSGLSTEYLAAAQELGRVLARQEVGEVLTWAQLGKSRIVREQVRVEGGDLLQRVRAVVMEVGSGLLHASVSTNRSKRRSPEQRAARAANRAWLQWRGKGELDHRPPSQGELSGCYHRSLGFVRPSL